MSMPDLFPEPGTTVDVSITMTAKDKFNIRHKDKHLGKIYRIGEHTFGWETQHGRPEAPIYSRGTCENFGLALGEILADYFTTEWDLGRV